MEIAKAAEGQSRTDVLKDVCSCFASFLSSNLTYILYSCSNRTRRTRKRTLSKLPSLGPSSRLSLISVTRYLRKRGTPLGGSIGRRKSRTLRPVARNGGRMRMSRFISIWFLFWFIWFFSLGSPSLLKAAMAMLRSLLLMVFLGMSLPRTILFGLLLASRWRALIQFPTTTTRSILLFWSLRSDTQCSTIRHP